MKPSALAFAAAVLGIACDRASPVTEARADDRAAPWADGIAVVELFTSEGCSSCPPADDVLADVGGNDDGPVFTLGFHVDYWDELGWPDRFASHEWTARQRTYARALGGSGLYTPQMIVGGVEQFTGSDRARADAAIARQLARPAVPVTVRARLQGDSVVVDYDVSKPPARSVIDVALVQRKVVVHIGAGENAGRDLRHTNAVRAFASRRLAGTTGTVTLATPAGVGPDALEIIAYVQSDDDGGTGMPILGAARARVAVAR